MTRVNSNFRSLLVLHDLYTIYVDRLSMYPGGGLSAKVGDERTDLVIRSESAYRNAANQILPLSTLFEFIYPRRIYPTGAYAIHVYTIRSKLPR